MKSSQVMLVLASLPIGALAEVTIYGEIQGSLGRHSQSAFSSLNTVQDTGSNLGIKGTEKLSGGLQAIWQAESRIHLDGDIKPKGGFGSRETFIGLNDPALGKVRLGHLNSPRKDLITLDQWKYSGHLRENMDNGEQESNRGVNGLILLSNQKKMLKNALRYDSPQIAGFRASLAYGFGQGKSATKTDESADTSSSEIFGLGLSYQHSPGFISYGYDRESRPHGIAASEKAIQGGKQYRLAAQTGSRTETASIHYIETGYKDDRLFLGLGYQQAKGYDWTDGLSGSSKSNFGTAQAPLSAAQAGLRTRQAVLSAAYTIGAFTPKISIAKGWDQRHGGRNIAHSGYRQVVAGVDYRLSKRTVSGLSYGTMRIDRNAHAAVNQQNTTLSSLNLNLAHRF